MEAHGGTQVEIVSNQNCRKRLTDDNVSRFCFWAGARRRVEIESDRGGQPWAIPFRCVCAGYSKIKEKRVGGSAWRRMRARLLRCEEPVRLRTAGRERLIYWTRGRSRARDGDRRCQYWCMQP